MRSGQAHLGQRFGRPPAPLPAGNAAGIEQRQFHVFQGAGAGQEVEVLEDEADPAVPQSCPGVHGHHGHLVAVELVAAAAGPIEDSRGCSSRSTCPTPMVPSAPHTHLGRC